MDSNTIKGVMMATYKDSHLISHSGTTFAGPIFNTKDSYKTISAVLNLLLDYYEQKYSFIEIKTTPQYYSKQELGVLDYLLLKRGYQYGMTALANIINISGIKSEDDIMGLYDSKRRNQVKKAIKCDKFIFQRTNNICEYIWEHMNQNLINKFNSHTTHSYDEIVELHGRMPENIIPYEIHTTDGTYAAYALIYKFKNAFHTQYLDLNYDLSKDYPNLLLIHKLIEEAAILGYNTFSFGASTERGGEYLNEGLFEYKSGYGGGSILLPLYTKQL